MADGKRNNKHYTECLNSQIMNDLTVLFHHVHICKFSFLKEPLFVVNCDFTLCLDKDPKSLSDHIDTCVLSMPNTY